MTAVSLTSEKHIPSHDSVNRIPSLITQFQDMSFLGSVIFSNDQYQERSAHFIHKINYFVTRAGDTYRIKGVWPHHDPYFINNFTITGEYNLDFILTAHTDATAFDFVATIMTEKHVLSDFMAEGGLGRGINKVVTLNTKAYLFNIDCGDVFDAWITFKSNRNHLTLMSTSFELPTEICDRWYALFVKYHNQRVRGPQFPITSDM